MVIFEIYNPVCFRIKLLQDVTMHQVAPSL